ncbi:MAG: preprotein translocase subunit SecG [Akkermansiaceae bacterium]
MIFAAINWLAISINLLLVVFVIVCLLMALLILMQRPKQEGLGAAFGGGVTDQVFGARTTNVLQKGTVYLGSMFFILSLTLAILIGKQSQQKSLLDPEQPVVTADAEEEQAPEEVSQETPTEPSSLADELPTEETPAEGEDTPAEESVTDEPDSAPEAEEAPATEEPATEGAEETSSDKPE